MASAVVAWLIDIASCSKKNRELMEKAQMVFAEYCSAVNDLGYFVAKRCKKFSQPTDELKLSEWLCKLADSANYPPDISPAATMDCAYFHISSYVRNIKATLLSLRQQYCMLVESDIIDTNDFRQHTTLQLQICDDICDALELIKYDRSSVTKDVNENLLELESNARAFFPSEIAEIYSWDGKG